MILYQDCSTHLDSSKKCSRQGRGLFSLYMYIENLKNLLVRSHWTDFNITWQECFFCNPQPRLFKPSWFVKTHGHQGAGLIFPIYLYWKLEKSSCQKHWAYFNITSQKCFLGDPLPRLFKPSWFVKKHGRWGGGRGWGGAYFPFIENY